MPIPKTLQPSVCIDAVLADFQLEDALKLISQLGYSNFEFWAWWEKDLAAICKLKQELNLNVAACCTKFISLTDPSLRYEYARGVSESIVAAKSLGCSTLISQVGDRIASLSREEQHASIVDGLRQVAPMLSDANITLVIEPLNEKVDHPGYYLINSKEAFEIVSEVDCPNIKVVFDIYHQQISEGDLLVNILSNLDKIGHFHAAGNPGRNEPTRGEINYPFICSELTRAGFQGFMGLEYWPTDPPEASLKKILDWFETTDQ